MFAWSSTSRARSDNTNYFLSLWLVLFCNSLEWLETRGWWCFLLKSNLQERITKAKNLPTEIPIYPGLPGRLKKIGNHTSNHCDCASIICTDFFARLFARLLRHERANDFRLNLSKIRYSKLLTCLCVPSISGCNRFI